MKDLVDFESQPIAHVVPEQLEPMVVEQVLDIRPPSREEVVEADDFVAGADETLAEV